MVVEDRWSNGRRATWAALEREAAVRLVTRLAGWLDWTAGLDRPAGVAAMMSRTRVACFLGGDM